MRLQLGLTLDDAAAKTLAELLVPAIKVALGPTPEEEKRQAARLIASRNAIYAGQMPPDNEHLLIDSRRAAKLLGISERTLWGRGQAGDMPQPIRIGNAVRWSVDGLKNWIETGCPRGGIAGADRSESPSRKWPSGS